MFSTKNLLILLSFGFSMAVLPGCHKPNPHPESMDPIFADLEKEKKETESKISAEEKNLAEFKQALRDVVPQTGQIKYAQKRIYETEEKLNKLRQRKQYLEVRLESRIEVARKDYLRAFEKDQPWPNPKEYETYRSQKELESAPRTWSVRDRIEKAAPPKKAASGHGESHEEPEHH